MILQALNRYYDQLVQTGKLEKPGWQGVNVSFALEIAISGQLIRVIPLQIQVDSGKKKVLRPQTMNLPAQIKKSSGIASNFLCENASYIIGIDNKGKEDRTLKCFEACRRLHLDLLKDAESDEAEAVRNYFKTWDPETAGQNPKLAPFLEEILRGGNLIFSLNGQYVHTDQAVQKAWDRYYSNGNDTERMRCLVTGELAPIARLHPSIRGVGPSTGCSMVSFNAPAFESYGRDGAQGRNAPVSEKAAFAYSAALSYMVLERCHHYQLGDTTVVFWAEGGEDSYAEFCSALLSGNFDDMGISERDIHDALKNMAKGRKCTLNSGELDPNTPFYILGVTPNKARLSIRFFLQNSFGAFANNLEEHHERLNIVRPSYDERTYLSFWHILNETVNPKAQDKNPSSLLIGELVQAVLTGARYPAMLMDQIELRIRAEREVNRGKAAVLKAYLLKNSIGIEKYETYKEALQVELNEQTNYPPYLLGRLFSVLEGLQQSANPEINTTIKDRFFNSACATPAVVYPQLIKLSQTHLKKLDTGYRIHYETQISDLMGRLNQDLPRHLNLYDQGIFQIGYYHQTQKRFTKGDKENARTDSQPL